MGSGTSVTIEVKETSASLNSVAAAWLGSCPLAAGLRNAHPGTVQLCRCGQPGRYLGRSGPRCSKACAAEAGEEPARLVRWWNSPRMGACGYCGPDGVTPDSFWPAEPEFENSEGSEGGSGSENDDSDGEEGGSVVSGISWGAAEGVDGGDAAAQQAEVAAPPAAHAALVEPAAEQAAALGTEQQQEQQQEHRKRSAPSGAEDAAEQPPLQRRRNEAAVEGQAGAAAAAAAGAGVTAASAAAGAAVTAAGAAVTAAGAAAGAVAPVAAAAGPRAAHLTAARNILAAPPLAQLQAAAAAAAAAQQQLEPLRQLVAGPPQDVVAAALQCQLRLPAVKACADAEDAWERALSAYQLDLPLRLTSHLMAADCQRAAPKPARRGGQRAPRQRRISAAAAAAAAAERAASAEGSEDEMDAINRAHEDLDFSLGAQRVLDGPSPSLPQRAARASDVFAYAAAAAAPQPAAQPAWRQRPADPMSALRSSWDDTSSYLEMMTGGGGYVDPVAAMRRQAQRAALPAPQQLLGNAADMLAMQAELARWRSQVMAWYQAAPAALATWLAERERREARRGTAGAAR